MGKPIYWLYEIFWSHLRNARGISIPFFIDIQVCEVSSQIEFDVLHAGAFNHEIHGHIFGAQGFSKLGEKYLEHAKEERDFAAKFINRIIDLGGKVEQNAQEAQPVCEDFKEYLAAGIKAQSEGVAMLADCIKPDKFDIASYELLKELYLDEEEDLFWMEQQCELIERIGYQNYLVQQV